MSFFLSFAGGSRGSCSFAILNRLKTVERSMTHLSVVQNVIGQGLAVPSTLSGAAHCRSPLKSIVTPLFTFARQHMGPDCKALAERCRSDARRSTLTARIVPGALWCGSSHRAPRHIRQVHVVKLSGPFLTYFLRGGQWVHGPGLGPTVRLIGFF
ncbi:hypothetical protein J6590_081855 [Homalodisca vitripennis]|nr:hypothetical protein J6590_081855 [Homalodisca vitripennis]